MGGLRRLPFEYTASSGSCYYSGSKWLTIQRRADANMHEVAKDISHQVKVLLPRGDTTPCFITADWPDWLGWDWFGSARPLPPTHH